MAAGDGLGNGLRRRIRWRCPQEGRIRRPTDELGARRARRQPVAATLPPSPPPQHRSRIPDPRHSSRITGPSNNGWRRRGRAFSSGAAGRWCVRVAVPCRVGDSAAASRRAAGQEGAQVASPGARMGRALIRHHRATTTSVMVHYQKNQLLYGL
uniref:Uncharacterized protein n=1 Tax=Oryza meridionalis TaxID=40149 RepID=A0A0E0EKA4_9ORYZ